MNSIKPRPNTLPAELFKWRDRFGQFHAIDQMVTRHLFHTVSMIWNHTMPPEAATHAFERYDFGPFYTDEYKREAIRHMLPELLDRPDLTPEWKARLDFMRGWLFAQEGIEIRAVDHVKKIGKSDK